MKSDLLIIMFFVLVLFLPLVVFLRVYRNTFSAMAKNKSSQHSATAGSSTAAGDVSIPEQSARQDQTGKEAG
jgi:hypothetical protein